MLTPLEIATRTIPATIKDDVDDDDMPVCTADLDSDAEDEPEEWAPTATTYSIDDAHGDELCDGLSEHEAYETAQRIAARLGQPVYLWAPDADEAEEVQPSRILNPRSL